MLERPPECRTAEIASTISELHVLPPKLAGKGFKDRIVTDRGHRAPFITGSHICTRQQQKLQTDSSRSSSVTFLPRVPTHSTTPRLPSVPPYPGSARNSPFAAIYQRIVTNCARSRSTSRGENSAPVSPTKGRSPRLRRFRLRASNGGNLSSDPIPIDPSLAEARGVFGDQTLFVETSAGVSPLPPPPRLSLPSFPSPRGAVDSWRVRNSVMSESADWRQEMGRAM